MGGELHGTKERADLTAGGQTALQGGLDPADLALAGQKDQDATLGAVVHRLRDEPSHRRLIAQGGVGAAGQPAGLDRIGAAFGGDERRIAHQRGDGCGIERGRHHQKLQILAQGGADFQGEGQTEIGVQAALVKLVEDHAAHTGQGGVGLDHSRQDAFGHHLDPGRGRDLGLAAYAVTDGLAHRLAQGLGHPLGGGAGGQTARLQHDNPAGDLRQKCEGHTRGLARAGWGLQHRHPARGHGGGQGGQRVIDGQPVGGRSLGHPRLIGHWRALVTGWTPPAGVFRPR